MPNRIHVIGGPGSGKSTLARNFAAENGLLHVELDALFWNDADGAYDVRRDPAVALGFAVYQKEDGH